MRCGLDVFFGADAEEFFEEGGVAAVGTIGRDEDGAEDGDEADGGGDGEVEEHALDEPAGESVWTKGLRGG